MAENRRGLRVLSKRAGLSYADTKLILFKIMMDTPDAAIAARELADAILGEDDTHLGAQA